MVTFKKITPLIMLSLFIQSEIRAAVNWEAKLREFEKAAKTYYDAAKFIDSSSKTDDGSLKDYQAALDTIRDTKAVLDEEIRKIRVETKKVDSASRFLDVFNQRPHDLNAFESVFQGVCDKDDKCLINHDTTGNSHFITKEELKRDLSLYVQCNKNPSQFFGLFPGDTACNNARFFANIKEFAKALQTESKAKQESLKRSTEKLVATRQKAKETIDKFSDALKIAEKKKGAYADGIKTLGKEMVFKLQGEIFDMSYLLLDKDRLAAKYGEAFKEAQVAQAWIDQMADQASTKISETVLGNYINNQITAAIEDFCVNGIKQCSDASLSSDDKRSYIKKILEYLKMSKEDRNKGGGTPK